MANELRVRQNFLGGLVEDNPLTAAATTLTSTSLAAMVAIGTTQHLPVVIDPDGIYGEPEIVWVTAHTVSAGIATILRGQEGTTARQHNRDVTWLHGSVVRDFPTVLNAAASSAFTLSTTITDVPGATITTVYSGVYFAYFVFDYEVNTAPGATDVMIGDLFVNGVAAGGEALWKPGATVQRATISSGYSITAGAGIVVKLRASRQGTTGSVNVNTGQTSLSLVGPF